MIFQLLDKSPGREVQLAHHSHLVRIVCHGSGHLISETLPQGLFVGVDDGAPSVTEMLNCRASATCEGAH
jgi:hypothetical protein